MFHPRLKMCSLSEKGFELAYFENGLILKSGYILKSGRVLKLTLIKSISMHDPLMRAI